MNRSLLIRVVASVCLGLASQTHAVSTLPFYEPFPTTYGEGEQLGAAGSSGVIWDFGNSTSSSCGRIVTVAAQSYPQLTTDTAESKGLTSRPQGSGNKNRGVTLTLTPGTTLYASLLFSVQTTNLVTSRFFGFSPSGAAALP
jgi:hypothetical protein